jgi:hypothetical protein
VSFQLKKVPVGACLVAGSDSWGESKVGWAKGRELWKQKAFDVFIRLAALVQEPPISRDSALCAARVREPCGTAACSSRKETKV